MRMTKQGASQRGVLITVLVVLGVGAGVAAWWQSDTILVCRGTVALIQGDQQTNPKDEPMSLVVTINFYRETMKIDDGSAWPLSGDTSGNVLVAMSPGAGSATLNRVTGTASINRIVGGLEVFTGTCVRSQQRLF
jgi:hypothetical protein